MFVLLGFPFFLSVSLYLFNRSISLALPLLFISASFSTGRVSFLGVTMGSPYPFQSPHRFTTTSAWSKTSSSQVKRALHSEWKHIPNISSLKCKNLNFCLTWPCSTGCWFGMTRRWICWILIQRRSTLLHNRGMYLFNCLLNFLLSVFSLSFTGLAWSRNVVAGAFWLVEGQGLLLLSLVLLSLPAGCLQEARNPSSSLHRVSAAFFCPSHVTS